MADRIISLSLCNSLCFFPLIEVSALLTSHTHVLFSLGHHGNKSSLVVLMNHLDDSLHRIRQRIEGCWTVVIEFLNLEIEVR
ncbi:hypothetical protein MNBD_GAMMA02-1615, partial [hydrothermal vent metagenome]